MSRARAVLTLSIAIAALGAGPAAAATVSSAGGVITFAAAAGEVNGVSVDKSFTSPDFILRDSGATLTPGPGCQVASEYVPNDIYCGVSGVSRIRILLGDGTDSVIVYSSVPPGVTTEIDAGDGALQSITSESSGPSRITGGPGPDHVTTYGADDIIATGAGDDQIRSGEGHDDVDVGDGTDEVHSGGGADTVQGGPGDDLLYGDAGMDTVRGGDGDDSLWGEQDADVLDGEGGNDRLHDDGSFETGFASGDQLNGGPGKDTADYGSRGGTAPVNISLDRIANDGSATEADNVGPAGDVEVVEGSGNDDVLTGSDNADELHGGFGSDRIDGRGGDDLLTGLTGNDQLAGGEGNDTLEGHQDADGLLGEGGNDVLLGGTGDDSIQGGAGADLLDGGLDGDVLLARDGVVDTIRCSLGSDSVDADAVDAFSDRPSCEKVTGAPGATPTTTATGGSATAAVRLTITLVQRFGRVLRTGIVFRAAVPAAGRLTVTATVDRRTARRLRIAAARQVTIGRASARARGAGTVAVRVKLARKARSRLRRARSVKVTLRIVFSASDGRRSTLTRRVTLRR